MKQRNDPYYFLFAICVAIFVYYLFYDSNGRNSITLEVEPIHNQFLGDELQNDSQLVVQKDSRDTIRKIADSTPTSSKQIFLFRPKLRQPTSVKPESQSPTQ